MSFYEEFLASKNRKKRRNEAIDASKHYPSIEESAITLFCWWEALAASPHIFRSLVGGLVPGWLKTQLLAFNHRPDFWILFPCATFSLPFVYRFLFRMKKASDVQARFEADDNDGTVVVSYSKRENKLARFIRAALSVGIAPLKNRVLTRLGVSIYQTFDRPANWPKPTEPRKPFIDRITYQDHAGTEVQYSDDYEFLFVRRHGPETSEYGAEICRPPTADDIKLLLFASDFFWRWILIYFFKRLLPVRKNPSTKKLG